MKSPPPTPIPGCAFLGDATCCLPDTLALLHAHLMLTLFPSCPRSTQSWKSPSRRPWWSWRSCREVSSLSSSRPPRSPRCRRAVNPPPSTGESPLLPSLAPRPHRLAERWLPLILPPCLCSYDGFPELRAELFESPQEQTGALPVPGPSRSAPSSPAPRRTKQVSSRGPSEARAQLRAVASASSSGKCTW